MLYEDSIEPLQPAEVTLEYLSSKVLVAETQIQAVQEAILFLSTNDEEYYSNRLEASAKDVKKSMLGFVLKAQQILRSANDEAVSLKNNRDKIAETAVKIKSDRVLEYAPGIIQQLTSLAEEIETLASKKPETDQAYYSIAERHLKQQKKAESLLKDGRALSNDAVDCGLTEPAKQLEAAMRHLKLKQNEADTLLTDFKESAGITTGSHPSSKTLDLSPPSFSGEMTDKLDFYSFKQEFEEYSGAKNLSKSEQLRVLLRTSLQGPAQNACTSMKDLAEVWSYLRKLYGNQTILFNSKVEDIRKLGKPTGSLMKKREWAMNVVTKLDSLHEMAKKYKLENELYYGPIVNELKKTLPFNLYKDFKDAVQKQEDEYGITPKNILWDNLLIFLNKYIADLTTEINLDITTNTDGKRDRHDQADQTKASGKKAYSNTRSNNGQGQDRQGKGQSRQGQGQQRQGQSSKQQTGQGQSQPSPPVTAKPALRDCKLCQNQHTHLFYCKKFIRSRIRDRYKLAARMKICFRCLRSDSEVDFKDRDAWWDKHKTFCITDFPCKVGPCAQREVSKQYHFTMCSYHVAVNKEVSDDFVKSLDSSALPQELKPVRFFYSTPQVYQTDFPNVTVSSLSAKGSDNLEILPDVDLPSIFLLQNILVDGDRQLLMFYDSGCSGAALSDKAYNMLETETVRPGPTVLNVASNETVLLEHGDERFLLDMDAPNQRATITGIRMPFITSKFPQWDLQEAWEDLESEFRKVNPDSTQALPRVDKSVGGTEVDLMLGIRYNKYFPDLLFSLPGGLGLYKAKFRSARGCQGILGGPHQAWKNAKDASHHIGPRLYFTLEARSYLVHSSWVRINQDKFNPEYYNHSMLPEHEDECIAVCQYQHCSKHSRDSGWTVPTSWEVDDHQYSIRDETRRFTEVNDIGSDIEYRCIACRNCSKCRQGELLEKVSLKEEAEQVLIESSVSLDPTLRTLNARLPFTQDPELELKPNYWIAEKVLNSQMRTFEKSPEMREDTLASHQKLLDKGHVSALADLPEEHQKLVSSSKSDYHIPWRTVYNEGSLSTPCRMVFDASSKTKGGKSLNCILAKGQNRLAKLLHLLLRFRKKRCALTADISMAYNGLKLIPEHYAYQKYLWKEQLDMKNPTIVMIVKTLIYGVKSAGSQTIAGISALADHAIQHFPEHFPGASVLKDDIYMDDIIDSEDTLEDCRNVSKDIEFTLALGSMKVKSFTLSGSKPAEEVSADRVGVGLVGYIWEPEQDLIRLDIKELYFGKTKRGKRPEVVKGDFTDALKLRFTRRTLVGKANGVFDPLGLVTPVSAKLKLDLHNLCRLKLDWDDEIPAEHLDLWVRNLNNIQSLRDITFKRTVIPDNASSTNIQIIVSVDASENLAIACVHARVLLNDGSYSCQLLTGKSKLVVGSTIPRAELRGAVMGSVLGQIVKHNLAEQFESAIFVTDSTICLFWINQDDRPLQVAVRNAVIQIRRFTQPSQWYHTESHENVADIGTRHATVNDISEQSEWQQGKAWMRMPFEDMPLKTASQVTLSSEEKRIASKELKNPDISGHVLLTTLVSKVSDRYSYSKYLVDPCHLPWKKSVRVLALVKKFISVLRKRCECPGQPKPDLANKEQRECLLTHDEISDAERYFFEKATKEVKQFSKPKDWKHCTRMIGKVLHYVGRILEGQEVTDVEQTMIDLEPMSFVKPILDRHSPVAYAIMIWCHQSETKHRNALVTLRESFNHAYIISGRDLANEIRESCVFCRRYKKRLLEVEMGKVHETRLTIAPAFFNTQVDIMGPFTARCEHNHRSTVKVWGLVFKDPATSAVAVHAMTMYNTASFLLAYTRFSARYGHPSKLYIDEGSQLLKASKEMQYSWVDIAQNLNANHSVGIEYTTCPVGGHNMHGMVERSIQEVKKLFHSVYDGIKLDLFSYETAFIWTANELNNLPVCLGTRYVNLDHADLITPSRLLLGRNNRRAPAGLCRIETPSRLIDQLDLVYESWWEVWKKERISDFVPQPVKWRKTGYQPKPQDIVVFTREEKDEVYGKPLWRIGRIRSCETSKDDKVRVVVIEYRNADETVFRTTRRAVRRIAVLHKEGDLELTEQLNQAARAADIQFHRLSAAADQTAAVTLESRRCVSCKESMMCETHAVFFSQADLSNHSN